MGTRLSRDVGFSFLQSLEYADKPDYAMLFGLFERTMKRRGVRDTDPFDWEKAATDNLGLSGIATPTGHRDNNRDATVDNDQENLEPDNRKDIRISDLDKKRLGYGAGDADLGPLSPRIKEGGAATGGTLPGVALDRNANAGGTILKGSGSSEEKGAEDRDRNEKLDKEGDAVMLTAFNGEEEKKLGVGNTLHRELALLALDVTRTEGDYGGEPLSPSARLGREAWTTSSAAGVAVTSPAGVAANAAEGGQSLSNFNAKGTLERRSGRRMHVSVTGAGPKSSLKYRSVSTYGDNSVTQMAMMDDDNVSAAITHGGAGGVTLHSRWKSQFDDSEASANETEMKGENLQSPEHKQEDVDAADVPGDRGDDEPDRGILIPSASPPPLQIQSPTKPMPREDPPKLILKPVEDALLHPNKGKHTLSNRQSIMTKLGSTL